MPAGFGFIVFVVLALSIAQWAYRVNVARSIARRAGLDENEAAAATLLDRDGLSATYLASSLRRPLAGTGTPRPNAESRLRELRHLLEQGLVTQAEYDARRRQIIADV